MGEPQRECSPRVQTSLFSLDKLLYAREKRGFYFFCLASLSKDEIVEKESKNYHV